MERQISVTFDGIDSDTPLNEKLCAKYIRSFAYYTVKDRLPVTLTKVINDLAANKAKLIGSFNKQESEEDLKNVISKISKLKNELVTNKIFIKLCSKNNDIEGWNNYLDVHLEENSDPPCWYYSPWLYVECYMYRRLWEIFENSKNFSNLDPFASSKEEAFYQTLPAIKAIAKDHLIEIEKISSGENNIDLQKKFTESLKLSLWSNRCDLSLYCEKQLAQNNENISLLNSLDSCILCDDSSKIYEHLQKNPNRVIDFVTDNAAFELFSDFCLCDFLLSTSLVSTVKFHVKSMPWYVSDATKNDVKWLLTTMEKEDEMHDLAERWKNFFDTGIWSVLDEKYWTLPNDFDDMKGADPNLYESLAKSNLIVFKGDLNYRKLLGDVNWNPSEKFETALGKFRPAAVASLRTVKSDLICGLPPNKFDELSATNKMWMRTGEYAIIQFCKK